MPKRQQGKTMTIKVDNRLLGMRADVVADDDGASRFVAAVIGHRLAYIIYGTHTEVFGCGTDDYAYWKDWCNVN